MKKYLFLFLCPIFLFAFSSCQKSETVIENVYVMEAEFVSDVNGEIENIIIMIEGKVETKQLFKPKSGLSSYEYITDKELPENTVLVLINRKTDGSETILERRSIGNYLK